MASIRVPNGCRSRPGIEQVLRYPVGTRMFENAVKEYYDMLRMDKELSFRDQYLYKYLEDKHSLRRKIDPSEDSEGYPDSKLYKLLNESYLKYRMQIQHRAIEEFIFLRDVKDHYIKLTKGPESKTFQNLPDSLSPRSRPEYFSPRSRDLERTPSTREVPTTPIRINGVIYYPQPMYQESNSRISLQNELVSKLQTEVNKCNQVIDDLRDRLSKTASRELKDGGPSVLYTDNYTPTRISEEFNSIFIVEWSKALKSLTANKMESNEEEAISLLMNIVQNGYEFCRQYAVDQLQKLSFSIEKGLEDPFLTILDLRNVKYDQRKRIPDSLMRELKRMRKAEHAHTIVHATQKFKDGDLLRNPKYNYRHSPEIEAFVNSIVEALWLMAIQDPPMTLGWPQPNDVFNDAMYMPYKKQGSIVKHAVWPAVYLHAKGPLIKKGYVQPV
ncbi:uncharacterized protein LOC127714128 [Mytilus californianus]|uniref:uncharacterized protein LOC127714128 n=1 Tax=Mytilus californianus TaxID=6549 RepID=UPI0022459E06|nr:uncharacterized protein LOC127714128 [Mytilus californianus]XP_052076060.1 uncharacterized protein LOC127714128 [Mytilus californianus]XP_052076061.1 uncharacterized protein LOC127714128 [Mytilus californianus]